MNTKLLAAAAALLAMPAAALADPSQNFHRDVFGPTTLDIAAVGSAGFAICDSGAPPVVALAACGSGGIGAIIDVSSLEDTHAEHHHFANGECSVEPTTGAGAYSFICGTDRDDDNFVTNVDSASNDPTIDDFDDDYVRGDDGNPTVSYCFRRDIAAADHDWDTWAVFIAVNVPFVPPAAGAFSVDISATAGNACAIDLVSGHTHDDYYD